MLPTSKRYIHDIIEESENMPKRVRVTFAEDTVEDDLHSNHEDCSGSNEEKSIKDYFRPLYSANTSRCSSQEDVMLSFAAAECQTCGEHQEEDDAMTTRECTFCCQRGCGKCTYLCFNCNDIYCGNCSIVNYDSSYERRLCIDCNCTFR